MQQRRSGGEDVKWVEIGRINCRCVRSRQQSQPMKSATLIFFKSVDSRSWHTDRCLMESQFFVQEVTERERERKNELKKERD